METHPALIVDLTTVTYVSEPGTCVGPVTIRAADGRTLSHSSAVKDPVPHRQRLLDALDDGCEHGLLTTSPLTTGRHVTPIYWYVPGQRVMKLGCASRSEPVWRFEHGIAMDPCGYTHALVDPTMGSLTLPGGTTLFATQTDVGLQSVTNTLAEYRCA
jgi:hypothetical protein